MVARKNQTCFLLGCSKSPTYGFPDILKPQFCKPHATRGMVRLKHRKCGFVGCPNRRSYGFAETRNPQFCPKHATQGMVDVTHNKCGFPGCFTRASHGDEGRKPEFCKIHATQNMTPINSNRGRNQAHPSIAGSGVVAVCSPHRVHSPHADRNNRFTPRRSVGGGGGGNVRLSVKVRAVTTPPVRAPSGTGAGDRPRVPATGKRGRVMIRMSPARPRLRHGATRQTPSSSTKTPGGTATSRSRSGQHNTPRSVEPKAHTPAKHKSKTLTETRGRELLETDPENLVGLTYQEHHRGYGGWWESEITEVLYSDGGVRVAGARGQQRPLAVVVKLTDPRGDSAGTWDGERKIRALLTKLKAWDKRRRELRGEERNEEGERQEKEQGEAEVQKVDDTTAAQDAVTPLTPWQQCATRRAPQKDTATPSSAAVSATKMTGSTRGDSIESFGFQSQPSPSPVSVPSISVTSNEVPMARNPLSALQQKMREVERDNSRDRLAAFAICPAMSSADVDKPDVVNAHLTSCTNRATEKEEISVEEKRASAVAAAVRVGFGSGGGGTRNGRGGEVAHDGRYNGRRRVTESVPMDTSVSSDLAILVGGDDVVSVVAALEGLSTRRLSPSARLCDSAMKTLLKSRCRFRTECIRRLLKGTAEAHPHCWQPLAWGRFEDSLRTLAEETADEETVNAHAAAVGITLDSIEAHRRRVVAKTALRADAKSRVEDSFEAAAAAGGRSVFREDLDARRRGGLQIGGSGMLSSSMIAPLLLEAGGNSRDGREAVKKCARWAAQAWARRAGRLSTATLSLTEIKACLLLARALGESLEAFILAAAAATSGDGRIANSSSSIETEGCMLVVVELEAHGGEMAAASAPTGTEGQHFAVSMAAARSQCGLLLALARRPFYPRLAAMLLERLPPPKSVETKFSTELEKLSGLLGLRIAAAAAATAGRVGGSAAKFAVISANRGGRGGGEMERRRKALSSGTALLLEDLL